MFMYSERFIGILLDWTSLAHTSDRTVMAEIGASRGDAGIRDIAPR